MGFNGPTASNGCAGTLPFIDIGTNACSVTETLPLSRAARYKADPSLSLCRG